MLETSAENEKKFLAELEAKCAQQYQTWFNASTDRERQILKELDAKIALQHQTWMEVSSVRENQLLREFEAKVAGIYQAWLETIAEREKLLFRDLESRLSLQYDAWLKVGQEREQKALSGSVTKQVSQSQRLLATWIRTRVERDRIIITFSAMAVGIVLAMLATGGIQGIVQRLLALGALLGFSGAVITGWSGVIFNADHLDGVLKGDHDQELMTPASDKSSAFLAGGGIFCVVILLLLASVHPARPVASFDPVGGQVQPLTATSVSGNIVSSHKAHSVTTAQKAQGASSTQLSTEASPVVLPAASSKSKASSASLAKESAPVPPLTSTTGGNQGNFSGGRSTLK